MVTDAVAAAETSAKRTPPADASHSLRPFAISLCAVALLLAWLPRLHYGFWTDEAGTFWMACAGWWAAISRSWSFPGQSVLYGVLESFFVTKGFWEEPLLRIPSVVAMVVAAWQLKKIAESLIGPDAGWLVVAPFFCSPEIAMFGTSARPYALAMAASVASFRYLLEWQETAKKGVAVKYLVASVLTLYFHYLFGFIFVIQAAYLVFCHLSGRRVRLWLPLIAAVVLPLSLLPLISQLRLAAKLSKGFADAAKPTVFQLLQLSLPPVLLLAAGLGAALLVASQRKLDWQRKASRPESIFLVLTWMLLGPVAFFAVSQFTHLSIFATRYLLFSLPAFLLALAWLISGLRRSAAQILILLAIFSGTVLHPGSLFMVFRPASNSWREPIELVSAASKVDAQPVFVASGVMDSAWLDWKTQNPSISPLYAALTAYPIPNRAIPLPYQFGEPVQEFIRQTDFSAYQPGQSLFLLAASDSPLGDWMSNHMKPLGFRAEVHPLNDYVVIRYRRE